MKSLNNKTVIITGASSGIGEATARLLAERGANVVLGARRADRLQAITTSITDAGGKAIWQCLDVTNPDENAAIVKLANESFGRLDAIFLNAGLMPNAPVSALKTDEWQQMVDINITGVLNGVAAVMPGFLAQKAGHIIATSSIAGLKAYPNAAVYGGTKWFLRGFMESLRMELAIEGTNIRTATVYPAAINTELLASISDKSTSEGMQALYKKYGIPPERIADVVAFALTLPEDTTINEFTVGPANQPW